MPFGNPIIIQFIDRACAMFGRKNDDVGYGTAFDPVDALSTGEIFETVVLPKALQVIVTGSTKRETDQ